MEIVSLIIIGIILSIDAFSVALVISIFMKDTIYYKIFPLCIGIFHFFMPIFGNILGLKVINSFNISGNILLGVVLIMLDFNLFKGYFKEKDVKIKLSFISILILSFLVSIDAFSVGIGINSITNSKIMPSVVFSLISFLLTYIGLLIGLYSYKKIGKLSSLFGAILLLIVGIIHLF